ncbi:tetratricopeptide repeat protein [candidate division KSB1 bacterium]|nr:tetratricopeptide repeat protein [candidate division KSB1 bacterium]
MFSSKTRMLGMLLTIATLVILVGCGPKAIKEESVLDTPENHFNRGILEFDRGNLATAINEFDRAKALNPEYPEAYAGLGLVYAQQAVQSKDKKVTEEGFRKAYDFVDRGLGKNDKSVDCRIIKGRIITLERKGDTDDWVEKAAGEFNKAIKLNPNSPKAYYFLGKTYKEGYKFRDAANAFSRVISMKTEYAKEADQEYALVQKIERAAPGTKIGMKIALIPEIDRADLAVLLMEELKLITILEKKRPKTYDTGFKAPDDPTKMAQPGAAKLAEVSDVDTHWAKNWIKEIVDARGMEPFPDHTFRPDDKITRTEYATIMQNILVMATGDQGLATKYVGEPSRFPDVNSSHFAYNAIALMVDRGVMTAETLTGEFDINGSMSGADALLSIRQFQNALRMEF